MQGLRFYGDPAFLMAKKNVATSSRCRQALTIWKSSYPSMCRRGSISTNKVYQENLVAQKLIRHEAEHDALTDALNRGAFEKILSIYEQGDTSFAMIMVDVDVFKQVNDTYGHSIGDKILVKVANNLQRKFRSIDYICRIGGDEFAIVMVDVDSDLKEVVREKIAQVNENLSNPTDGLPTVSLSVGVAFSDRENPGDSIFKDADKALYKVKNNGRHSCGFYER